MVAIKLLPTESTRDPKARQRLLREARSASALNHPNIVTIYAIEEIEGMDFIVMEYVEGQNLRSRVQSGPVEFPVLLNLGVQIADALAAAHSVGVIHRDIKSANILITPQGQAKVLDFGLAKVVNTSFSEAHKEAPTVAVTAGLTSEGIVVGTVAYMSPEQTRAEPLDSPSDIFSLGVVLYEAATARLPFTGPSLLSIMHEIAAVTPPPPSAGNRNLPRAFDYIVERTLAKDKERRFRSASELANELRALRSALSERSVFPAAAPTPAAEAEREEFVGRGPELRRLEDLLRQAMHGSGRIVFITGEPGIGKSSLADTFLRHARNQYPDLVLCRGRCVEQYGTGEA